MNMPTMTQLSRREKMVLSAAVVFAGLALIDRVIVAPIIQKMTSLQAEISVLRADIEKSIRIEQQQPRIEAEERRYAAFLVAGRSPEEELAGLLRALETMAAAADVALVDLKPGEMIEQGSATTFAVSVSCEARMANLLSLLHAIANSPQLLEVKALAVYPKSRDSTVRRCDFLLHRHMVF